MYRNLFLAIFLIGLMLSASSTAQKNSAERVDGKNLTGQIREYLSRLEGFGFSGAALVAKDGKILVETQHGFADREKKIPVRRDTLFDIGSVTKQFTGAAILMLESEGKLRTNDSIAKYFKNVPDDKSGITVHHLLTHTAGMEMGFGGDYERVSREEIIRRAMASKLLSAPGERHSYSNAGYSLLAAIVEIVSGQSYDSFLRERFFKPLGMTATGYFLPPQPTNQSFARGYIDGEAWGIGAEKAAATGGDFWNLLGNGGLHSTLGDMNKWVWALNNGKALPQEAREKFFRPHVLVYSNYRATNTPLHYAYGWYVSKFQSGKTMIWHLGGNGVFNFALRNHVDDSAVVVYATNNSAFSDPKYPVPAIERMLAGESVPMPPQVQVLTERQLAEYAGKYKSASGALLSVEAKAPFLKLQGEGQEAFSLVINEKWQSDSSLEVLNKRTAEAVENSRNRNFEALLKSYGPEVTLKGLEDFETAFWRKRHANFGEYIKTRVLGTIPSRNRSFTGTTIVAIDFARGTAYREYLWTPQEKIGDLGPLSSTPSSQYFPQSDKCFVRFDPAAALVTSRICFEKKPSGEQVAIVNGEGSNQVELKKF